ncbi:MAG: 50S ribosomal protein L6 [Parcubacteria group bacterium GW2011_GWA1_60_11]|uniref:Large ribosomal subunit protein uL6 n=1 Tax=Candidatus Liptonbacteria bacterium RIFCSPLOWO2_12_FULL_60_15 TaxID=1798653 RepID=A0A1G2CLI5_9BACT|nr:MAG: 50S ribosomal protein L6 [Parcubacteria group bacterium GW2011_GWA1_60_11]OGZ02263.1 MAG: 50S ribosomal protein L6 [Candidatus Liptonbacteria bacterium RIFCSPLOWO2_12_FULL_60_15]
MSKVGKKPVSIPEGVTVSVADGAVSLQGKLGALRVPILSHTNVEQKERELVVTMSGTGKQASANWGTMRAHLGNAVIGVSEGFSKVLEIEGVGYRAALEGNVISFSLGYSHPVKFTVPEGVTVAVEKNTILRFSGISKEAVGQTAAKVRALKKPEPYKGKGIRYRGEVVRRKAGKKVASASA